MKANIAGGVILLGTLIGCTSSGSGVRPPPGAVLQNASDSELANDPKKTHQVNLDLIRGMLDKKQYYAALAYIEDQQRSGQRGDDLVLLEADARRHLGQVSAAEGLYKKLIGSRFEAQAYHGLGLLYVDSDLPAAVANLKKASDLLPTNVDIRSDLGYALMEAGRYTEAMPELSTAAELAPSQIKGRNNLVILMLLTGNETAASRLSSQSAAGPDTLNRLREEAQQIRNRQSARSTKSAG